VTAHTTQQDARVWWSPRRATWWTGVLFAVGATCFLVAPLPGFAELVGASVDAAAFFVGSIFFTSAAALQCLQTFANKQSRRLDWWSSVVQFVGTVFFNITTFRAMQTALDDPSYDRVVWAPDALGSICFLVSGYLAYVAVCGSLACLRRLDREWRIAAVNLLGCIAFGIAAVGSYIVPSTGSALDLAAANLFTALGGLCFLIGAVLLLPNGAQPSKQPATDVSDLRRLEA